MSRHSLCSLLIVGLGFGLLARDARAELVFGDSSLVFTNEVTMIKTQEVEFLAGTSYAVGDLLYLSAVGEGGVKDKVLMPFFEKREGNVVTIDFQVVNVLPSGQKDWVKCVRTRMETRDGTS